MGRVLPFRLTGNRYWRLRSCLSAILLVLCVTGETQAEALVPANLQVAILGRMLAYDRSFKARAGNAAGIGIVFKERDKESARVYAELLHAFRAMNPPVIQGLPVVVAAHPYADAASLVEWMQANGIDALYVAPGFEPELEAIGGACRKRQVVSMTGARAFVEKALAVGVVVKNDSPQLLINLKTVAALGMDLDSRLLKIAEVVR